MQIAACLVSDPNIHPDSPERFCGGLVRLSRDPLLLRNNSHYSHGNKRSLEHKHWSFYAFAQMGNLLPELCDLGIVQSPIFFVLDKVWWFKKGTFSMKWQNPEIFWCIDDQKIGMAALYYVDVFASDLWIMLTMVLWRLDCSFSIYRMSLLFGFENVYANTQHSGPGLYEFVVSPCRMGIYALYAWHNNKNFIHSLYV